MVTAAMAEYPLDLAGGELARARGEWLREGHVRDWPQEQAFTAYRAFCAGRQSAVPAAREHQAGSNREPGQLVREEWVKWAREQPDPKPGWVTPWEELDEGQREVDARIEASVRADERERCIAEIFAYTENMPVVGAAYRDAARVLNRRGQADMGHIARHVNNLLHPGSS